MSTKTAVEQRCCKCDEPTGKCGDDSYYVNFIGPLCEKCFDEMTFKMNTKTAVELSIGDGLTKIHFLEYRIEILQNVAVELGQELDAARATLKEIAEWGGACDDNGFMLDGLRCSRQAREALGVTE